MRRPNLTFGQNGDEVKPLTTNEIKPLSEDERRTLSPLSRAPPMTICHRSNSGAFIIDWKIVQSSNAHASHTKLIV